MFSIAVWNVKQYLSGLIPDNYSLQDPGMRSDEQYARGLSWHNSLYQVQAQCTGAVNVKQIL